jgi:hypothetical protein
LDLHGGFFALTGADLAEFDGNAKAANLDNGLIVVGIELEEITSHID